MTAAEVRFVGTDYLGMSVDPDVRAAAVAAIGRYGVSASAARTTTGTLDVHVALERELAEFLEVEDVVVLASGGHAAAAVVEAMDDVDSWWIDDQAHHSAQVAVAGVGPTHRYAHRNPDDLAGRLAGDRGQRRAVLTDAVFPEFGRAVDMAALAAATEGAASLLVDESHSVGVLGAAGRGMAHALGPERDCVRFGSLAKALGGFGGFVAASREMGDGIRSRSGTYGTSTALPPAICAALRVAVEKIGEGAPTRATLRENVVLMRAAAAGLEIAPPESPVPIFFVPLPNRVTATAWHESLLAEGLFVPVSGYGSSAGPVGLRWVVTALHAPADIARLGAGLRQLAGADPAGRSGR